MKEKKELTVRKIKDTRVVSSGVKEELKKYNRIKKLLTGALQGQSRSIPQLAEETGLSADQVTYYLMTLRKYNMVEVDELDENDEYYTYRRVT